MGQTLASGSLKWLHLADALHGTWRLERDCTRFVPAKVRVNYFFHTSPHDSVWPDFTTTHLLRQFASCEALTLKEGILFLDRYCRRPLSIHNDVVVSTCQSHRLFLSDCAFKMARPRRVTRNQQQADQQPTQAAGQTATTTTTTTTVVTTTQAVATQSTRVAQTTVTRGRAIRGPQSALTDFLASHNISANQIRLDHERRRREAQAQNQQDDDDAAAGPSNVNGANDVDDDDEDDNEASVPKRKANKRKLEQEKAIEKIKASKKFQKRKKGMQGSDEEDDLISELLRLNAPRPGQMENCTSREDSFTFVSHS